MARLLIRALGETGHCVEIVSELRSYFREADGVELARLEAQASAEAARLLGLWQGTAARPDLWFTYHPYYKAPDLLGPRLARKLAIPYVTAEASYAGKRDRDAWHPWQILLADALRSADAHFCFTPGDAEGLAAFLGASHRLIVLPPFVDAAHFAPPDVAWRPATGPLRYVTAAMMRPGVKIESYLCLAEAMRRLVGLDWHLTIIGDGDGRQAVEAAFGDLPAHRLAWLGSLSPDDIPRQFAEADLFLWPGVGEAYGMVYLEAQAAGLPVVAFDSGGVSSTLLPNETGILVAEGDVEAYASAVNLLSCDTPLRLGMGRAARAFARGERSLARAAAILDGGLTAARERHATRSRQHADI